MAFCSNCGAVIEEGASFCTYCGAKIGSVNIPKNDSVSDMPLPDTILPEEIPQVQNTVQKTPDTFVYKNNVNYQPAPVKAKNSWMGILGFILAFFMFTSPAAIVLGILDLVLKKGHRHGLAIWGLVIGTFFSIALIVFLTNR